MLVVAQFPIADLRPFLPDSAKRSRPVKWPPKADIPRQFVQAFGPAMVRQRGADWAWLDERVYCRADRALRFPNLPIDSEGWEKNIRCAFRRLLTDGEAVARVEVGVSWIPEDEETLLWRYWDRAVDQKTDPTQRLEGAKLDVSPLKVARCVASIPTTIHPMASGTRSHDSRELMLQGRALAELYWRATASKNNSGTSNGAVVQGAPLLLIECRSHWIGQLPRNFIRVGSPSVASVDLAFGRLQTSFGSLGVWILGHQQAFASEIRNLRLCLLRLHAEQEVLDIILSKLSDGVIEYRASDPSGGRIEEYLNRATRIIYRRYWGNIEQSAVLAAFDAADATEYRAVRVELAKKLEGAHRQVVRKVELFERRPYVRADRFIHVDSGAIYQVEVAQMNANRTINVGQGATINAPVVIADHIENSFTVLEKSSVNTNVKSLIQELLTQVTEAAKAMPPEKAQQMASDAEVLVKEVSKSAPRRKWYEVSIEGLCDAAKAIGAVGQPILETTAKLLPLLTMLFP